MAYPKNVKGTRVCISVTKEGVTIYGNQEAFRSLAAWISWLANSNPSEHYECHMNWHLKLPMGNRRKNNVWTLFDNYFLDKLQDAGISTENYDVTFMVVEKSDIEELQKLRSTHRIPKNWEANDA